MADPRDSRGPLQIFNATPSEINDQLRVIRDELDELHNAGAEAVDAADPDSAFVIVSADAALPSARHLAAGTGISVTDGGAGGAITVAASGASPTDATYVVVSANATLTDERVLTAGTGITLTDAGAGGALTIAATVATTIYDRVVADTTVTNTGTETTIYTKSITGGDLSTNKRLRLQLQCRITDSSGTTTGAIRTLTLRLKYGATTLATVIINTNVGDGSGGAANLGTSRGFLITAILSADTATAQFGTIVSDGWQDNAGNVTPTLIANTFVILGGAGAAADGTAAIDSTTAQTLLVSAQWSTGATTRTIVMQHAVLELL